MGRKREEKERPNLANYRHVVLLSAVSEILERIIIEHMICRLEEHHLANTGSGKDVLPQTCSPRYVIALKTPAALLSSLPWIFWGHSHDIRHEVMFIAEKTETLFISRSRDARLLKAS